MATVRKLSMEEVQTMEKVSKRRVNPFEAFFDNVMVHEAVEVELEDGDKVATVRNQLTSAAKAKGLKLQFIRRRKNSNLIMAVVVE